MPVEESRLYAAHIDRDDLLWFDKANCKGTDTDSFFIERGEAYPPELKQVCNRCSVKKDCLNFAVKYNTVGFWGGTSEMDRRQLRVAEKINGSAFKPR
jgi:hypothetical protein